MYSYEVEVAPVMSIPTLQLNWDELRKAGGSVCFAACWLLAMNVILIQIRAPFQEIRALDYIKTKWEYPEQQRSGCLNFKLRTNERQVSHPVLLRVEVVRSTSFLLLITFVVRFYSKYNPLETCFRSCRVLIM